MVLAGNGTLDSGVGQWLDLKLSAKRLGNGKTQLDVMINGVVLSNAFDGSGVQLMLYTVTNQQTYLYILISLRVHTPSRTRDTEPCSSAASALSISGRRGTLS